MLRARYLFDLARVCGVRAWETWDLDLVDLEIYTVRIDEWLKAEAQLRR